MLEALVQTAPATDETNQVRGRALPLCVGWELYVAYHANSYGNDSSAGLVVPTGWRDSLALGCRFRRARGDARENSRRERVRGIAD